MLIGKTTAYSFSIIVADTTNSIENNKRNDSIIFALNSLSNFTLERWDMKRNIAVAIPARNEADRLPDCLKSLARACRTATIDRLDVIVLANNCQDDTAAAALGLTLGDQVALTVIETRLPPDQAHAGWARRLALDAACGRLRSGGDLLLSTDADTLVAEDWLARTQAHIDAGYDAVAGSARLNPRDLRVLPTRHRARLARLRRYDLAINFLKASRDGEEPWPRHFYEGGASMALTRAAYMRIGGAPTPRVGEDKALFDAVRAAGGKVRHAVDVKVVTSARLTGRAAGGASDTLALWGGLGEDAPIPGVQTIAKNLEMKASTSHPVTFRNLPAEIERARDLVRLARQSPELAAVG